MKAVSGQLRLDLAQYRELAAFAQFGSDLDRATLARLTRGERVVEILKQGQYQPMTMEEQVLAIYAGIHGYLDDLPRDRVPDFEKEFLQYMRSTHGEIVSAIRNSGRLEKDTEDALIKAIEEFKFTFSV